MHATCNRVAHISETITTLLDLAVAIPRDINLFMFTTMSAGKKRRWVFNPPDAALRELKAASDATVERLR